MRRARKLCDLQLFCYFLLPFGPLTSPYRLGVDELQDNDLSGFSQEPTKLSIRKV